MKTTIFVLSLVILFVISVFGWYVWYNEQDKQSLRPNEQTITESDSDSDLFPPATATPEPTPVSSTATISGSLSFPSETIPPMSVCAENLETSEEICTSERIEDERFTFRVGYKLTVPPGSYHVYASIPNDSYRAYYNQFVVCGLSIDCPSHQPITVNVAAGETVTGIDPQDWYNRSDQD